MAISDELRKQVDPNNECCCKHCLSNNCKEWAISKGFITHSVRNLKEYVVYLSGDFREPSDDFRCNSEPEAIFKACQWILDNVKTNSLS